MNEDFSGQFLTLYFTEQKHEIKLNYNIMMFHKPVEAHNVQLTRFFSSSVRTSLRTFAQGRSLGHQTGRHSCLPHPGLLLPVEYFNISGMKFLSCAYKFES